MVKYDKVVIQKSTNPKKKLQATFSSLTSNRSNNEVDTYHVTEAEKTGMIHLLLAH